MKNIHTTFYACFAMMVLAAPSVATAQFATGGSGLHKERIFWVDWGSNGEDVIGGKTVVRGFNIGSPATPANRVDVTCTLSNATSAPAGSLNVYPPGNWQGDGLDDLYNIGGFDPGLNPFPTPISNPNTLTIGLRTSFAATAEFDFGCSATLGGTSIVLPGLVFADAEASGGTEFVGARLTNGGTMRIIDKISNCGASSTVNVLTVAGSPQYQFNGPTAPQNSCENNGNSALRSGPALVGFIDGATSARVVAKGFGFSAVAVGAMLEFDFNEAIPSSYGIAAHLLSPVWSGGTPSAAVNNHLVGTNFSNSANLATISYNTPTLGAVTAADVDAAGAIGGADVDALSKTTGAAGAGYANVSPPTPTNGSTYTISGVACRGPGAVTGWIDFNGNGTFDAGEKSTIPNCGAGLGSVSLSWTIPADYLPQVTSYLRLRTATSVADLNPTGIASNGEVEDYRLVLPASADMQAQNTIVPASANAGASVAVTGVCTNAGPTAADAPTCSMSGLPSGVVASCTPSPVSSLAVGATITCNATFVAPASGPLTIVTTAGSASPDPVANNHIDSDAIAIVPQQADMRAVATVPATVHAGSTVTVSGVCTNAGPNPASAAACALSGLPAGAAVVCTPAPVPNPLAVGSFIACSSTFVAPASGALNVTATASTTTPDPAPANNTDTKTVPLTQAADMRVAIAGIPSGLAAGANVAATVTCTNQGPSLAVNAQCLVSGVPQGAVYSCTPAQGGTLAVGADMACSLSFSVPASGVVHVLATASTDTFDTNAANNQALVNIGDIISVPMGGGVWLLLMAAGLLLVVVVTKARHTTAC